MEPPPRRPGRVLQHRRYPEEAAADPHFAARGLFAHRVRTGEREMPALPVPIDPQFRAAPGLHDSPALGDANADC